MVENILVYSSVVFVNFIFDWVVNLAIVTRVYAPAHEPFHPYQYGAFQIMIFILCAVQIVRNLERLRFYW